MAYPTATRSPVSKPPLPAHRPPAGYHVAEEPSRLSLRSAVVILISLLATGISVYRIRDAFQADNPTPSPFQELQRSSPEYAELIMAIRERDYDRVERAIARDPWLVNFVRPESVGPPLLMAALTNQPDLVDLLIDHGADINVRGRWGGTPLHWAAWRGSADAVEALVHRGADVNALSDNDASTPLFWACRGSREAFWSRHNHAGAVRHLLAAGASPDAANRDGFSAVAVAPEEIASLLLQHGASPQPPASQPTYGSAAGDPPRFGFGYSRRSESTDQPSQQPSR